MQNFGSTSAVDNARLLPLALVTSRDSWYSPSLIRPHAVNELKVGLVLQRTAIRFLNPIQIESQDQGPAAASKPACKMPSCCIWPRITGSAWSLRLRVCKPLSLESLPQQRARAATDTTSGHVCPASGRGYRGLLVALGGSSINSALRPPMTALPLAQVASCARVSRRTRTVE
jgi:hypothetical protein